MDASCVCRVQPTSTVPRSSRPAGRGGMISCMCVPTQHVDADDQFPGVDESGGTHERHAATTSGTWVEERWSEAVTFYGGFKYILNFGLAKTLKISCDFTTADHRTKAEYRHATPAHAALPNKDTDRAKGEADWPPTMQCFIASSGGRRA